MDLKVAERPELLADGWPWVQRPARRIASAGTAAYAISVGIIQVLGYQVRQPATAQRAMQHVAATRAGAWVFARTLDRVDKALLRLSRGQVTLPGVLAGLPVLTVTTTGARTGQHRSAPWSACLRA